MKKLCLIFVLLFISLFIFSNEKIRVAVSANMAFTVKEIKIKFEKKYPDIEIDIITASSGKLTAQILNGAPFDIFLSADMKYPEKVIENNLAASESKIYAKGKLIIFSIHSLNLNNLDDLLTGNKIKTIAIANPDLAPYGKAAMEYFNKKNMLNIISKKLIFGENANQTINFSLISADMGIIPESSVYSKSMKKYNIKGKYWIEISEKYYSPIEQGAVILKHGKNNSDVRKFYNFLFSEEVKKILLKFGYSI